MESSYNNQTSLETIKEPAIVTTSAPSLQENVKCRFCKLCGGEIDSETKRCTKCGKQYFKGIKNYFKVFKSKSKLLNKIIISILVVAVIGQAIGLICLGNELTQRTKEYEEKNRTVTTQKKRIEELKKQIEDLNDDKRYISSVLTYSQKNKLNSSFNRYMWDKYNK